MIKIMSDSQRIKEKVHFYVSILTGAVQISINKLELKVPGAPLHARIQLRISPDKEPSVSEVRFWHEGELLNGQKVKNDEINLLHF